MKARMSGGIAATVALLFTAAPAMATGGFSCQATDKSGIEMAMGLSHTPIPNALNMRFIAGGKTYEVDIADSEIVRAQTWFDDQKVMIDLVAAQTMESVAHLRTINDKEGKSKGTIKYRGKTHPVTCEFE